MFPKPFLFVLFVTLLPVLCLGTQPASSPDIKDTAGSSSKTEDQCAQTRHFFADLNIGAKKAVPLQKVHDGGMKICYNGKAQTDKTSCCTRRLERKLMHRAEQDFYSAVRATSSYLKNLISTSISSYQGEFLKMLEKAKNSTDALFVTTYKIPLKDRQPSISALFTDLQLYLQQKDVNVHDSVEQFFDDLFPLVFHNILNDPSVTEFNKDYQDCLMEIRQQVYPHPFGDTPHKLSHMLGKSLSAARAFLDGLRVGLDTVNRTDFVVIQTQCGYSLTKMRLCPYCDRTQSTEVKPCRQYCSNVMRGCLAKIHNLDTHWNNFVDAMVTLPTRMSGVHSLDTVLLNNMHVKIDEGIMHAMENSYKFYDKVVQRCGYPQTDIAGTATKYANIKSTTADAVKTPATSGQTLEDRVRNVLNSLKSSHNFYRNIADTLCDRGELSAKEDDTQCWNGETIGRYTKPVTEFTYAAQTAYNPEMKVSIKKDFNLNAVQERLKTITRQIRQHGKKNSQDDSPLNYPNSYNTGGGSGYYPDDNNNYDDEYEDEYEQQSGSGSGNGGYDTGYYKPNPYYSKTNIAKGNHYNKNNYDPDISFDDDNGGSKNKYSGVDNSVNDQSRRLDAMYGTDAATCTISSPFYTVSALLLLSLLLRVNG